MKKIYLVGIGGSGLSAIARLLLESGYTVSGSDQSESPITASLSNLGATIYLGHKAEQVLGADLVIQSSAIADDNPEVNMAHQLGIHVQKRAAFLEGFLREKWLVAVAGTAGKTTTTAMLAWVLTCLEMEPGYLIGGISRNLATNAHAGKSDVFIIEADEYDRMFHGLHPRLAIITNAEHDHPDMFPTPADYYTAFDGFIQNIQSGGKLLVHQDVPALLSGYHQLDTRRYTFGSDENTSYQAKNLNLQSNGCYQFDVIKHSEQETTFLASVALCVPGKHNVLNALAALAAVDLMDLSVAAAACHLEEFEGVQRRFEIICTVNGISMIDDYAHHPTKIRSTLQAARAMFPERRIWAVWQPHTFTRTAALFDDFLTAFDDADQVLITEVYAAREKNVSFSSAQLVEKIKRENCTYLPDLQQTCAYLAAHIQHGDVVIVLSAGDANSIIPELTALLEARVANENHTPAAGTKMDWADR
jgi:UDP-N-acetylmuramate--alanine ligase